MDTDRFPNLLEVWNKPATRGDLLKTIVAQRSVNLKLFRMIVAVKQEDDESLKVAMDAFFVAEDAFDELVAQLSGNI